MIPLWGGAGNAFPTTLPGLAAWYRYGKGISTSGSAVTSWADASGNGRDLTQATGGAQPALQGDNTILFDGTSDFMFAATWSQTQPETIYLLGRQVTWTASDSPFDGVPTLNTGKLQQTTAGASPQVNINAGSAVATNGDWTLNTYMAVAVVFNGAGSSLRVNNNAATTGNAGAGNLGGFSLGGTYNTGAGSQFANIQVKEVIIYSAAHTSTTQDAVIAYLLAL